MDFRDDRLFIVACDDTYAPKQYFGFFSQILSRVHIHVIATEDNTSHAEYVLNRLMEYQHEQDDELWMVTDVDHYADASHIKSFNQAIKKAKNKGVHVALSKPSFDIWLLLHHMNQDILNLKNANKVGEKLRDVLGGYNKTQLQAEHYPLHTVCSAYHSAKKLDQNTKGGDIPQTNTTRVYLLWKNIINHIPQSQLPEEFLSIKNEV